MSDLATDSPFSPWKFIHSGVLLTFGVGLPVAAILYELATHINARTFFDPLPTLAHIALVTFVIAANAWCCLIVTRPRFNHAQWAARANGVAIGVSAFYSVLFAPLIPLSTIAFIYYPLTGLAFAPLAALVVALRLRVHLRRRAKAENIRIRAWPSALVGLAALFVMNTPATVTAITARMAAAGETVETRARGMYLLRRVGSERVLLRMCYERSGLALDLISLFLIDRHLRPLTTDDARALYYRVTGNTFNSVPPPVNLNSNRSNMLRFREFDMDQGAEGVGSRAQGLSLESSRLDGSVSAEAALGYLEWTMVFANAADMQREARMQVALPPGAVVSRVTLWIDGEEREAAFAGRREVRQAYEAVVRRNRDPVLVTSAGTDRVSVQLFPVPPAGQMKVRIGMTIPLRLTLNREGILYLPAFQERNFEIDAGLRHAVWIESTARLRSTQLDATSGQQASIFRAVVEDAQMFDASIVASRGGQSIAWSPDTHGNGEVVQQTIHDEATRTPPQVVLVVDGSKSMAEIAKSAAKSLADILADVPVRLVFAQDEIDEEIAKRVMTGSIAAKEMASFDYDGGHDNTTALARGIDIASEQADSVLIWIHGPQPMLLRTAEPLLQRVIRGRQLQGWYELQLLPGTNKVTEGLEGISSMETIRAEELPRLIASWRPGARRVTVTREKVATRAEAMPVAQQTSDHLVRLWANDEIARIVHDIPGRLGQRAAAIEMAQRYQLVTAVSGAVVLETQQQYDAAGLQPVPEGTVPTIPEPEEWALIIIALLVLAYAYGKRRSLLAA